MKDQEERVGKHYDSIFDYESNRLVRDCPVEFAMTCRALERWVPAGSAVAEIGVGGGHYTEFLARRGCSIHLVDVSKSLLNAAQEKLKRAGLNERIAGVSHASATRLDTLADAIFDAVLLLGGASSRLRMRASRL